jgi:two-component system cell cycle sensor histidine kinase/response regulator CckA
LKKQKVLSVGDQTVATILLVEDDEQVRVLAESFLQTAGHMTLSAASPEQALAVLATEETIDLMFVDVSLHGDAEAGLSLAANAVEKWPDLKVLYTSGQSITDGMTALFVKDCAYLPKPYTVEQLGTMLSMKFDLCASSQPNGAQ